MAKKEGAAAENTGPRKGGGLTKRDTGGAIALKESFFGSDGVFGDLDIDDLKDATMENVDASEIKIPRMAIMQPTSPLVAGRDADFKSGQVIDNVDHILLSREVRSPWLEGKVEPSAIPTIDAVLFLPIFKLPTEAVKWKDRDTEGKGMWWKTLDLKDRRVREGCWPPHGVWQAAEGANKKSPPVTINTNFAGAVYDPENPNSGPLLEACIGTFAKTSSGAGKDLITKVSSGMRSNIPIFGRLYWLWLAELHNDVKKSTYYAFRCSIGPLITEFFNMGALKEAGQSAVSLFNTFRDKENGRAAQEGFLNASSLDDDDDAYSESNPSSRGVADAIDVAATDTDTEPKF